MNALKARKRYDTEQARIRMEERLAAENAYISNMTPEQREKYEADKLKSNQRAAQMLQSITSSGAYGTTSYNDPIQQFVKRYAL